MPSPPTGTTPPSTAPADRDQQAASRHLRPSISSPPANTSSHHTKATLRRPSHFNYSDPDAAAAASFCADKDYISAAPSSVINAGPQSPDGRPRRKSSATLPIMDLPSLTTGYEDSDRAHAAPFRFDDDESQVGGSIESLGGDINRPLLYSQDNQHEPIRRKSTKAKIQFKSRRVPSSGSDKNEGKVRPAPVPLQSGDVSHRWVSQERIDSSQSGRSGNEKDDRDDIYEEGSDDDEEDDTSASSDFGPDYEAIGDLLGSKPDDGGDKLTKGLDRKKYQDPPPPPRVVFYSQQVGTARGESLETISLPPNTGNTADMLRTGPFWIDVTDPTHSEMMMFSRLFGIHPLTTEDIQTDETREKCEMFINYYFICIRTFDQNQYSVTYMQPINVYIVVFKDCVLSFHCKPIDHVNNVLKRIGQLKSYGLNITPDWINYALIDDVTDTFMPLLRFIELEVDSIDDLVLILKESEQSDMLRRIGHARKKVMQLLRLLSSKAEVLRIIIKRCGERLPADSETSLYLGDIQDHVITMVQNLSHYEKTLARSHSNYLAQISIEITQASNRTNDVVMKMTAMASILLPLNVVTGLFGMNVQVPGQYIENYWWFVGIVVCMIGIATAVYVWARRYKLV